MLYEVTNWPLIGHEWVIEQLTLALNSGRTRHAYLISGPPAVGKGTLALAMAMAFNCTNDTLRPCGECRACTLISQFKHPDIMHIAAEREGGTLKIDQVRDIQRVLSLRPYEARRRVAIFDRFHEANAAAQNALLKTLEEPPGQAMIILLTSDPAALLPTIHSRCQPFALRPLQREVVAEALVNNWSIPQEDSQLLARLSGGRLGWAIAALDNDDVLETRYEFIDLLEQLLQSQRRQRFSAAEDLAKDKARLLPMLRLWQSYWRDALLLAHHNAHWMTNIDREAFLTQMTELVSIEALQNALAATQRTLHYLQRNVNTRLALETLLLDYPFMPAVN